MTHRWRTYIRVVGVTCALFFILTSWAWSTGKPPSVGGVFPDLSFPIPADGEKRQYLGIEKAESFRLPQIKADLVIVEIFSMYCPYCQKEAPLVNQLYELIEKDKDLKGRLKIIGIGAGNTTFEVGHFQDTYKVPFPLIPDDDFTVHDTLGQVRTPFFLGVRINKDGSHKVIYAQAGSIKSPEEFLQKLLKEAEL